MPPTYEVDEKRSTMSDPWLISLGVFSELCEVVACYSYTVDTLPFSHEITKVGGNDGDYSTRPKKSPVLLFPDGSILPLKTFF